MLRNSPKGKLLSVLLILAMALLLSTTSTSADAVIAAESWSTDFNDDKEVLTIARPEGLEEGDLLLAQITYEKGKDAWPLVAPEGWTRIITTNAYEGGGYKDIGQALYWKIAGSHEPPMYTWAFAQSVEALGGILRYSGVRVQAPIGGYNGLGGYGETSGMNQIIAPGLDAETGDRLVGFFGIKELATIEEPFGMTRLYEERDDENDYTILAVDQVVDETGETGDRVAYSWEYDDFGESIEAEWVGQMVLLRPVDAPLAADYEGFEDVLSPPDLHGDIMVYVDMKVVVLDVQPFIEDGRTLIPMRAFFEALGARVAWDAGSRTAIGMRDGSTVWIPIDSTQAIVDGAVTTLEVPTRIVGDRTYIPLRFVGEAFGDEVLWEESSRSIYIFQH